MDVDDWASSSDETADSEVNLQDTDDEELQFTSDSIPKLQFRKNKSMARWDTEMGMAEVVEKKGQVWMTTGIVRRSKVYCSIEETLFLAEIGALVLLDVNDTAFSLKNIYAKVAEGKSGCCWEAFEAYRHLKSLGYIVSRHGVPWTVKSHRSFCDSASLHSIIKSNEIKDNKLEDNICVTKLLKGLEINEVKPDFDVYLPNGKFRKSSPGDPSFMLCLTRGHPPSRVEIENLERKCNGIPLKFCHVEQGCVSFFSFNRAELPVLP